MRRDKLRRRNLLAAKLYSKWALRRMADRMLDELTEQAFAEWRREVDARGFRPTLRYAFMGVERRSLLAVLQTAAV